MEGVFNCIPESVRRLPTLPEAPQKVIHAANDPLTSSEDLARIINGDASLSMRVLRLTNSVLFSGRQATTDTKLACARLGMRGVANVAQCVAQAHIYRASQPVYQELMQELWKHAVATARMAEALSNGVLPLPTLFLAGLVHDVGKVVLLDAITTRYQGRTGQLTKDWDLLMAALDTFAPYCGLQVVQHWDLPQEVRFTTFYQASPSNAPAAHRKSTALIALASAVAELAGYGFAGRVPPSVAPFLLTAVLGIADDTIDHLVAEAQDRVGPYIELAA
jgi:HD-like signal output (HDOD) protein